MEGRKASKYVRKDTKPSFSPSSLRKQRRICCEPAIPTWTRLLPQSSWTAFVVYNTIGRGLLSCLGKTIVTNTSMEGDLLFSLILVLHCRIL